MATVIHIRQAPRGWNENPDYVYIGRPGKNQPGEWGNPHPIGYCKLCDRIHDRSGCIKAFEHDLREWVHSPQYRRRMETALRGRHLVCFCKPEACHGDVFVKVLDEIARRVSACGFWPTCQGEASAKTCAKCGIRLEGYCSEHGGDIRAEKEMRQHDSICQGPPKPESDVA